MNAVEWLIYAATCELYFGPAMLSDPREIQAVRDVVGLLGGRT